MSISGKVRLIDGKTILTVKHKGIVYPLIKSNATAVEAYLHSGDQSYLLALAPAWRLR